jgi:hypothetical protein
MQGPPRNAGCDAATPRGFVCAATEEGKLQCCCDGHSVAASILLGTAAKPILLLQAASGLESGRCDLKYWFGAWRE